MIPKKCINNNCNEVLYVKKMNYIYFYNVKNVLIKKN